MDSLDAGVTWLGAIHGDGALNEIASFPQFLGAKQREAWVLK